MSLYTQMVGRNEQIWVFSDFPSGQEFSQNRRYLFQYLEKDGCYEIRPIWLARSRELYETLSKMGYEVYPANSLKARYYTLRAGYIPIDAGPGAISWWCTGGATVIQMGHGIPLKADNHTSADNLLVDMASWNSADYAVFSSQYCETHFREYFDSGVEAGFLNTGLSEGTSIYTGYPKTDAIVNDVNTIEGIDTDRDQLDIEQSDVVIGYFPTRREGQGLDLNTILDVRRTEEFLQQNSAKLLIKPHRDLDIGEGISESNSIQLINSDTDSHQFLTEIDILITDYSSIYFDFLLLDRPVIFYTPDHSTYEEIRGVHPNYENVIAGPRVNNFEELLEQLESNVNGVDEYAGRRQEIRDQFFEHADGNASKRIFEKVID
ncbi:CDP-glycerol glycerophosphotransferase family protein [Halorhabdus sp. CBA1104]|uniref:CDP-glycerol glycerophosphotransferase family protein n=1 Tax=Halorhabdus sp. CBA1104 TaxID=1380432 RepID=UPI0018A6C6D4|nr:CDP-glycerol glycerophosphotransferase family protein [Halorhabdus sp. CBA1104]